MEIALAAIQNSEYEHNHRPSNIQTHTMNSSLHKSQQGDLKKKVTTRATKSYTRWPIHGFGTKIRAFPTLANPKGYGEYPMGLLYQKIHSVQHL
jgi:hypothetical protein